MRIVKNAMFEVFFFFCNFVGFSFAIRVFYSLISLHSYSGVVALVRACVWFS